jgi:hypothetical protein
MAEGEETNNDAGATQEGGADQPTSGAEVTGADPAGFEPSGVGDPQSEGSGGSEDSRPGDWNPGEQSGGGGELY